MKTLLVLLFLVQFVFAASFDCALTKKERSGVSDFSNLESSICSDPELSYLDEMVSNAYFQVKQLLPENTAKQLLKNQRNWLEQTRGCYLKYNKDEEEINCYIKMFKDRYDFFQTQYPNIVIAYNPLDNLEYSYDAKVCKQINDDFIESIKNVGVRKYALFPDISFRTAQLQPYYYQEVATNRFGITYLNRTDMKVTAKGKSLFYLQDFNGDKRPRSHETWLIDSGDLSQFLTVANNDNNQLVTFLKKGKLISKQYVRAYYQPKIGDIYRHSM